MVSQVPRATANPELRLNLLAATLVVARESLAVSTCWGSSENMLEMDWSRAARSVMMGWVVSWYCWENTAGTQRRQRDNISLSAVFDLSTRTGPSKRERDLASI